MAPANLRNPVLSASLLRFAQKYAAKETVAADISWKDRVPQTSEELCELEAAHQVRMLFYGSILADYVQTVDKNNWTNAVPLLKRRYDVMA